MMSEFEQPAGEPAAADIPMVKGPPSEVILLPGLWAWVRDLVVSVVIAGVVIVFLYQPVKVEGTSMMPRLVDQERIFINKFVYQIEAIERGDVIVFRYPYDETKSYIKRVIGLPGDEVAMVNGEVFINGEKLDEPYLIDEYRDRQDHPAMVVPESEYYVLGDRRNSSNDSRVWGPVPRNFIYGKAVFVYWPVDRLGFLP
jgi:signal peptidase I